ncbi:hypothetical protein KDW_14740 [Dictyobacter vulcani]|uniref:Uncharacterized protein n=1 Tax=Dictyobacter vulcani TaxID=2607529 RepID=A0A5J4KJX0_9CHLR|nr:hypothetical protein KDW_14740 [Dictyobacter vulcani]
MEQVALEQAVTASPPASHSPESPVWDVGQAVGQEGKAVQEGKAAQEDRQRVVHRQVDSLSDAEVVGSLSGVLEASRLAEAVQEDILVAVK